MTIKHLGGIFGRNPTFNDVDIEGDVTVSTDNTSDLGTSTNSFKDIYLKNDIVINGHKMSANTATIADDAVGSFTPPMNGGFLLINLSPLSAFPGGSSFVGMIHFDVGGSLAIIKVTTGTGSNLNVTTSDVDGTTGTDGKVTVAVQSGVVKVENRSGSSHAFHLTFL